ncbi:MAG: hypothetical protein Kow00127_24720 [Bacteroidales bacterium]
MVTLGLTIWLGLKIDALKLDSDILNSLPDDDPVALTYKTIGDRFGGNSMGMVILQTDNIYQPSVLEHIRTVTDTLSVLPGISTVTSLTNIIDIRGSEWGIEVATLLDPWDLPSTIDEMDSLKKRVMQKEMYRGNLVSEDGTATIISFTLTEEADKRAVAALVREKVNGLNLPETVYYGGLPMMMDDLGSLMQKDIARLLPVTALMIILILAIGFRNFRGVVMPLISAGIAIIWSMGLMQMLGFQIDLITNEMPVVLLAVGSAYTIHVVNRIMEEQNTGNGKAVQKGLSYIAIPVFLSGLTTVFGFSSFIFGAYLTMIQHFGIFTSLGVFFALLISLFFVPALLSLLPGRKSNKSRAGENKQENNSSGRFFLEPLATGILKNPRTILVIWGGLLVAGALGITLMKTSVNMTYYFRKDNPTRISEEIMQQKFGGSTPVFVLFEGDMQDPDVLKTMKEVQDYLKAFPQIHTTLSVADLIGQMNEVMGEGNRIPDEREKIEQLWFLLDGQDIMTQLVTGDLDEGIIQSRFASTRSSDMEDFIRYMEPFVQKHSSDKVKISFTGMPSVYVRLNDSLIRSQFTSLGLALVLVTLFVGLILRAPRKGVFATIPILATIVILFGFMGFAGIALDVATVLVASVALGMGIDYSVHIITHFHHELQTGSTVAKAVENTLRISGKAIVINVASVSAGFLVLIFSNIVPVQNFGLLVALSMAGSGLAALTILPVILLISVQKENNVSLKKN